MRRTRCQVLPGLDLRSQRQQKNLYYLSRKVCPGHPKSGNGRIVSAQGGVKCVATLCMAGKPLGICISIVSISHDMA